MRNRILNTLASIAFAGFFAACHPPAVDQPVKPGSATRDLPVGLAAGETQAWRFTPEGSDLVPVDILRALYDVNTRRPFSEGLDRYGFLPSPAGLGNPYGLAIGWTVAVPSYSLLKVDYVGVNCAACHTAELSHGGQALRIDGGPNQADIELLAQQAARSAQALLDDPLEAFAFVVRLVSLEPPAGANPQETFAGKMPAATRLFLQGVAAAPGDHPDREIGQAILAVLKDESADPVADEEPAAAALSAEDQALAEATVASMDMKSADRRVVVDLIRFLRKYLRLLKSRIQFVGLAIHAFDTSTAAGPGRDDPWNLIRNLLFLTPTALNSPVSVPALFHAREFGWYHADGNTNSVQQRNISQAVGLGAYVDPRTNVSTLLPRKLWELEDLMAKLESPRWPEEEWGEAAQLDPEKVKRGEAIFQRKMSAAGGEWSCADCHASREGGLWSLEIAGTDRGRAESFLLPQNGKNYPEALAAKVGKIEAFTNQKAGITPEEARQHEYAYPPQWRGTGQYIARKLDGIWATAPYLHNGSVPTLYDLLLPAAQRPKTFPLGQREYDLKKVGYVTEGVAKPVFVFDVAIAGNGNQGHEFGTTLSDAERWDLIEFLKTQ